MPDINIAWSGWACDPYFDFALQQAFKQDVDTVVFGSFWEEYFIGEYSVEASQQQFHGLGGKGPPLQLSSPGTEVAFERFGDVLARLVASGRRVFVILSNPTSPLFDPVFPPEIRLSRSLPRVLQPGSGPVIDAARYESFVAPVMRRLSEVAARAGAKVIDPRSTLCRDMACPSADADGMPLYLDSNHLSAHAARERASFLDEILLGGGGVPPFKQ